ATFADLDGDGALDLIVNTFGQGTHIFRNDGTGRFALARVLNPGRAGMSIAVADIDGDGDLDFYVTNYRVDTIRDEPNARFDGGGTERRVRWRYDQRAAGVEKFQWPLAERAGSFRTLYPRPKRESARARGTRCLLPKRWEFPVHRIEAGERFPGRKRQADREY